MNILLPQRQISGLMGIPIGHMTWPGGPEFEHYWTEVRSQPGELSSRCGIL